MMNPDDKKDTQENPAIAPGKYVSLHNHTGFSNFDGLGYPDEHFKFCIQNGIDAHAITEHGHMSSYAHAQLWYEGWKKENKDKKFKYIPGVEAYFHPDLESWRREKELYDSKDKSSAKKVKKAEESFETKLIVTVDSNDETESIETSNALTIENEDETKSNKLFNPVNRRHHLVLLPKNSRGLQKLFSIISKSYMEGFYRFPRIDVKMLKDANVKGDVIAGTACLGGYLSWSVFQILQKIPFDLLSEKLLDDEKVMNDCISSVANSYGILADVLGEENVYIELQFNRLPAQNLVNRALIEFAKRNNLLHMLIVAGDAHYYSPNVWKERELYKKLGFMNYKAYSPDSLPKSREELKCELYPKNASQIWDEYLRSKSDTQFYDDQLIRDAIERTHHLAHDVIEEILPDRSPKFPNKKLVPGDTTSFKHLVNLCKKGLVERGLHEDQKYIDRMKEELDVIKKMNNADYFVSYQKIMELAKNVTLCGPGRGSGAGSLVAYVLKITDIDPIIWELPFARFLSIYRVGAPDIDSDLGDRDKVLDQLRSFFGFENVVPISNYNTFKVKSLVKDVSKFYGIPFEEVNAATRTVEQDVRKATLRQGDDKNLFVLTYNDAIGFHCMKKDDLEKKPVCSGCTPECVKPISPSFKAFMDKHPEVGESINILFKQNRSLGRHAGGVLIADDLPNKMPLVTSKGEPQSPWVEGVNYKHLEYIGNFIKYDLLGLETMRLVERTIELILKKERQRRGWYEFELEDGTVHGIYGDQYVNTSNRGKVLARELGPADDVLSIDMSEVRSSSEGENA